MVFVDDFFSHNFHGTLFSGLTYIFVNIYTQIYGKTVAVTFRVSSYAPSHNSITVSKPSYALAHNSTTFREPSYLLADNSMQFDNF